MRPASNRLFGVLNNLGQGARLDSQGEFTLGLRAAVQKLGKYQLAEPYAYVLKLIQWAVRSHASRIEITIRKRDVKVWHDGDPPDLDRIAQAEFLLISQGALGHLGVGLYAALALCPKRVWIESKGQLLQIHPKPQHKSLPGSTQTSGTTVGIVGLPRRSFQFRRREQNLVRERCSNAGIPIYVNGRCVLRPIDTRLTEGLSFVASMSHNLGFGNQEVRYLLTEKRTPGAIPCPRLSLGSHTTSWISVEPENLDGACLNQGHLVFWPTYSEVKLQGQPALSAHAVICRHNRNFNGTVTWVKDGVVIEKASSGSPVSIIADASDLKTDLSQFALVKDEHYTRRLDWLRGWAPG